MVLDNRFNYTPILFDEDNQIQYRGYISNIGRWDNLNSSLYKIPIQFDCRPDLVSNYFYGTPKYAWLLATVNNISNTPKGFSKGITIIVPNKQEVL